MEKDKIGNISGDKYQLACIRCRSTGDLHQVAHRNQHDCVVGYVYFCGNCLSQGTDKMTIQHWFSP